MQHRKKIFLGSLLLTCLLATGWWWHRTLAAVIRADPSCRLIFLDVGQGDAILLQTPDRQEVMIDGGPSTNVSRQLGQHVGFGNNEIEMLILTHPDADHLTGALAILQEWPVTTVLTTGVVADTKLWHRWDEALEHRDGVITGVQRGQHYVLGKFLTIEILWPDRSWDGIPFTVQAKNGRGGINDTSIGMKITCAGSTAVMIGDASDAVEKKLMAAGVDVRADVLKVSHHGSKYSDTHAFIRAVHPDLAVVQVGDNNRYGHPHPTLLQRFETLGIPIYRTDRQGTLNFYSVTGGWRWGDN